ncbi:MAG: DUF421 domain-containing protein [Eubacterium sp.]|nr:DUF421 domain-containing protein [Eubacterium sp.]
MDFLNIIILGMVSFIVLFILSKIMGYRAISELSFFDYVVGITIGSVAAEMSTNIDMEWWKGVTAMAVYAILDLVFSFLSQKSSAARQIITGNPIILIYKGKIYKKNLRKARIELNDLLTSARMAGYFNIADIDYAIMETTGKISFMPVPLKRPLNPKDFNFAPQSEGLTVNVIMDGKIMEDDLADAKIDKNDLIRRVKQQDKEVKNVFLGVMDSNGVLTLFDK